MASRPWTAPIIAERNRRRYWEAGALLFAAGLCPSAKLKENKRGLLGPYRVWRYVSLLEN
ncbi:MAG: hypothetical protein H5U08_01535 [Thermogutta sp.]|nr:hypothetical protein [Thermogutta sp.]